MPVVIILLERTKVFTFDLFNTNKLKAQILLIVNPGTNTDANVCQTRNSK